MSEKHDIFTVFKHLYRQNNISLYYEFERALGREKTECLRNYLQEEDGFEEYNTEDVYLELQVVNNSSKDDFFYFSFQPNQQAENPNSLQITWKIPKQFERVTNGIYHLNKVFAIGKTVIDSPNYRNNNMVFHWLRTGIQETKIQPLIPLTNPHNGQYETQRTCETIYTFDWQFNHLKFEVFGNNTLTIKLYPVSSIEIFKSATKLIN